MEKQRCLRCRHYPAVDLTLGICFPCSEFMADRTVMDPMIVSWSFYIVDTNHVYQFIRKEGYSKPKEEFSNRLKATLGRARLIHSRLKKRIQKREP